MSKFNSNISNISVGVYGGTFDPVSFGHYHIIKKACTIFDKIIVVMAENHDKKPMFDKETRYEMLNVTIEEQG